LDRRHCVSQEVEDEKEVEREDMAEDDGGRLGVDATSIERNRVGERQERRGLQGRWGGRRGNEGDERKAVSSMINAGCDGKSNVVWPGVTRWGKVWRLLGCCDARRGLVDEVDLT
jgi:hypothetical protein